MDDYYYKGMIIISDDRNVLYLLLNRIVNFEIDNLEFL